MLSLGERVARVQQEIDDAFADVALPSAGQLIEPTGERDAEAARQFQEAIIGRRRETLTQAFLERRWASFCYLNPAGYRYYLPALLSACLVSFSVENKLVHATVFGTLTPSYWHLYWQGADRQFAARLALFSPAQWHAICSFLELVFDDLPRYQYLSARAVRYGWHNHHPHSVQDKVRELYRQWHGYVYPRASRPELRALRAQIMAAFADTPYPGDNQLCGSKQGDEPAEYALEFRGLRWQTLHPQFLAYNGAALSFFTAAAFRYFLPAFLVADLMVGELDGVEAGANPIYHLTHGFVDKEQQSLTFDVDEMVAQMQELAPEMEWTPEMLEPVTLGDADWRAYAEQRFAAFTRLEREAIVAYLRYCRQHNPHDADDIAEALQTYWLKTVA